ncbi:MAG TPA: DUF1080 domain-containing protein [Gemmataceae bacterium]|jgi:hypothetical protein|nr:DUF1080 domain-containing protein [Gemmataceae bacterium]
MRAAWMGLAMVVASILAINASAGGDGAKSVPTPEDAIVLFDGKNLDGWVGADGKAAPWKVEDGYLEVVPGKHDIRTTKEFGPDFKLHAEFWLPLMANKTGQARANSGIYLQGRYEVQVLDSYMNDTYPDGVCGALYGILKPSKNANKPPEQWQTYDITFKSPRVDDQGKVTTKGELTIVFNGETIIDKGQFDKLTGGAMDDKMGNPGPIRLQDHGCKDRFRNIWIQPIK